MLSTGSGWLIPTLKNPASGAASRACWNATPSAIIAKSRDLESIILLGPSLLFHARISANFWRSLKCAGLANPGTITRCEISLLKSATGKGAVSPSQYSTIVLLCAMRVVVRIIKGICQRWDNLKASLTKSYASCESDGSRTGSPPACAKERVSCSFWLEAIPGSSATIATMAP